MDFYDRIEITYTDGTIQTFTHEGMARSRTERYIIISSSTNTIYISTEAIRCIKATAFVMDDDE